MVALIINYNKKSFITLVPGWAIDPAALPEAFPGIGDTVEKNNSGLRRNGQQVSGRTEPDGRQREVSDENRFQVESGHSVDG